MKVKEGETPSRSRAESEANDLSGRECRSPGAQVLTYPSNVWF
jgi:hypothetical protein